MLRFAILAILPALLPVIPAQILDLHPESVLVARQANKTVTIASDQWKKCRQPVPCASNKKITSKYDVDACAAVAKRWNTTDHEEIESYVAVGPYDVNDLTNCQVYVSNLGANTVSISRHDMAEAIQRLSKQCAVESAEHNSVICDLDYDGGSVHLEVLAKNEKDMIAPVTQTKSEASGSSGDQQASTGTGSSTGTGAAEKGSQSNYASPSNSANSLISSGNGSSATPTPSPSASPSATPSGSRRVKRALLRLY